MRAHLILTPQRPAASPMQLPTRATISEMKASDETVEQARQAAVDLGFKVVMASPLQVTIEGKPAAFEKIFGCKLQGKKAKKADTAVTWETSPVLPEELKDIVTAVVLPQATKTHVRS